MKAESQRIFPFSVVLSLPPPFRCLLRRSVSCSRTFSLAPSAACILLVRVISINCSLFLRLNKILPNSLSLSEVGEVWPQLGGTVFLRLSGAFSSPFLTVNPRLPAADCSPTVPFSLLQSLYNSRALRRAPSSGIACILRPFFFFHFASSRAMCSPFPTLAFVPQIAEVFFFC